jgi:hypothetical protein
MRKKSGLTLAMIGLIFSFHGEVWSADWRCYEENNYRVKYYDAESITRPSKGFVRVWEKVVFTEKGVMEAVEQLGEKYKTLSYVTMLKEIHCPDGRICLLSSAFYSKEGKVLSSFKYQPADWRFIVPETRGEVLYEILCQRP